MPAKTKHNPRKTSHTRPQWGQRLTGRTARTESPRVVRDITLANGDRAAIAEVNGVFLLACFDRNERPLDGRPLVFEGSDGERRAYAAVSGLAGREISPLRWR